MTALELGLRGVRVNSVNTWFGGLAAQRIADPREVAAASLFLASDEASYIMGAELAVDGGMMAGRYTTALPGGPGT